MSSSSKLLRMASRVRGVSTITPLRPIRGARLSSTDISGSAGVHSHGVKYFPPKSWSDVPVDVYPLIGVTIAGLTMMSIIIYVRVSKDASQLRLKPSGYQNFHGEEDWVRTSELSRGLGAEIHR